MSSVNLNFSFVFSLFCITFVLPFINTAPTETRDDPFDTFIDFLSKNNCAMPKEVELPFPATNLTPFGYLSVPLEECKSLEALKENSKAFWLCKEVFIVLENITCSEYNLPLPAINSSHLSIDVCKDFAAIQNILPEQDEYLSRRLSGDNVICKLLCSEKYELLCKTLLWSYDTQAKIKNALDSKVKENGKESVSSVVPNKEASIAVQTETSVKSQETSIKNPGTSVKNPETLVKNPETSVKNSEEINEIPDETIPNSEDTKNLHNVSTLNHLDSVSKNPVPDPNVINESNSPVSSTKDGKLIKSNSTTQEAKTSSIQPDTQRVFQKNLQDEGVQTAKLPSVSDKNTDYEENSIEQLSKNTKIETPLIEINPDINSLTSENKINENGELNKSVQRLPGKENNEGNTSSDINIKPDEKLENSAISPTEVYNNDLNNIDFQDQENETKGKGKQPDLNKKVENPKESSISDGVTSETDSKLLESTVLPIIPDKNEDFEPHQEVKDPEQYNNGFSPSLKKEIDVKSSLDDGSNQMPSSNQISPENFPGHGLDGNRNYLPGRNYLPEQEDSHFFFYFLSIVLILMAGYLIFHNKQKIIALIVEGRHERRRRSHGAGYKKLETK